ncbi:MAG: hypothetical protein Q7K42_06185 [Candidatus Diapherotrites archaeon]|nr:hypothetical protein [Candidatus Diapherotrites archaeon]
MFGLFGKPKINEAGKEFRNSGISHGSTSAKELAEGFLHTVKMRTTAYDKFTERAEHFMRGIHKGSIVFDGTFLPKPAMQDWFARLHMKTKHNKNEKKLIEETVQERQACLFMLYELQGYFEHERKKFASKNF